MVTLRKFNGGLSVLMHMQRKIFFPVLLKYRDKNNPFFEKSKTMQYRLRNKNTRIYWIVLIENNVSKIAGYLILGLKNDTAVIGRIGVLKKYQNRGIASEALRILEKRYADYRHWWLDTIKQEKRNCHLYEKLGYKATRVEHIINKRMTIIEYEKESNSYERLH